MNTNKIAINIIIFAIFSIISAGILEVLVRQFIYNPNHSYIRTPGWQMTVRTNDLIPFVSGDHEITINRYGYRGALPARNAKPIIAVTGGSTVEDWVLSEKETWTEQLQSQLRDCLPAVEALNLGKAGANARHNLMQLEAVTPYLPRVDTFVVLMGLNDFLFDLRIHHPIELPEDWWRRQAFMTIAGDEGTLALVAVFRRLTKLWTNRNAANVPVSDFGTYMKFLFDAKKNVRPSQYTDELPDITAHLATYRETIRRLKAFADGYGANIYFVSQPFLWSASLSPQAEAQIYAGFIGSDITDPATRWYTSKALEAGLSQYNETLLAVCREDGLNCVDASGKLPREAKYFFDDFHFSEEGAVEVAKIVADGFRKISNSCPAQQN